MHKIYAHAFNLIPQFGSQKIIKLLNYFNDLKIAWNANAYNLARAGLHEKIIFNFLEYKKNINPGKEWQKISNDIKVVTIDDNKYPKCLKEISCPPFILYVRGNDDLLSKPSLAVVGSRKMSDYGKRTCEELVQQLTNLGLVIVSGLANGIDTVAHKACLNNKAKTIAVLGCGVDNDVIFPAQNRPLAKEVSNTGAVISEYPPSMKAQRNYFPARNRIISGLSLGVLIIEAAQKSGALITAYKALEQNREVFAVPNSIYSERSVGCNTLIKKGAKLVQNIEDIIEELPLELNILSAETRHGVSLQNLNDNEKQILKYISLEPTHVDRILKSCRLTKSSALSALTSLELKGIIKNINNHYYLCQRI